MVGNGYCCFLYNRYFQEATVEDETALHQSPDSCSEEIRFDKGSENSKKFHGPDQVEVAKEPNS